jgi:hypothetical protein
MAFGGSEEGGWWFTTGKLVRPLAMVSNADKAYEMARRANRLLDHLERDLRPVSSCAYSGGRHSVAVYENTLPEYFPDSRPHYE